MLRTRDTGVGIDADTLPRIFDLFVQANQTFDRSEGGLGLGLTIVKRLAELHDGSVSASSAGPHRGSEFLVRMPRTLETASSPASLDAHMTKPLNPQTLAHIIQSSRGAI